MLLVYSTVQTAEFLFFINFFTCEQADVLYDNVLLIFGRRIFATVLQKNGGCN